MFYLLILFSIFLSVKGFTYILGVFTSIKFIKNAPKQFANGQYPLPDIYILVPVLREQAIIEEMIEYFSRIKYKKGKLKIVVITTEKEEYEKQLNRKKLNNFWKDARNNTNNLIDKYPGLLPRREIGKIISRVKKGTIDKKELFRAYDSFKTTSEIAYKTVKNYKNIIVIHYPKTDGIMAHQLNYAISEINKSSKLDKSKVYFGVYNADSKPNLNTLKILGKQSINIWKRCGSFPPVFQQASAYLHNFPEYGNRFSDWILKSSSLIQTRWGLGKEIPMLINQSEYWRDRSDQQSSFLSIILEPTAYTVGHGMYFRADIIKRLNLFPEDTPNEDLASGYYATLSRLPITPIHALENVDNPDSISVLIDQKASWFWGMIDYLTFARLSNQRVPEVSNLRRYMIAIKGLFRDALAWQFSSLIPIVSLVSIIYFEGWLKLIPILGITFYAVIPSLQIYYLMPLIFQVTSKKQVKISHLEGILSSFISPIYLLISSIGPWRTFINKCQMVLFNKQFVKKKTER